MSKVRLMDTIISGLILLVVIFLPTSRSFAEKEKTWFEQHLESIEANYPPSYFWSPSPKSLPEYRLEDEPWIISEFSRYRDEYPDYEEDKNSSGSEEKPITQIGAVLLKEGKLHYAPFSRTHGSVQHWVIVGQDKFKNLMQENVPLYCKLKGYNKAVLYLRPKPGVPFLKSQCAVIGYAFRVEEVLWLKSEAEMNALKSKIISLRNQAYKEYKAARFKEAVPLLEEMNRLAESFVPNLYDKESEWVKKCFNYQVSP